MNNDGSMTKKGMIMIFFDIDGTLLDNETAQTSAALALYRQTPRLQDLYAEAEFPGIWNRVTETCFLRYTAGRITFQEQRQERLREILKKSLDETAVNAMLKTYLKAYEDHWQLYPDVIPLLERYKDTPKGIISNGDRDQQRRKLEKTGIDPYFEVVVVSDDIGVFKPDPGIFEHAARLAGKAPSQCWYIGDRVDTDAKAAKDAGMTGVWINRKFIDEKKEKVPEVISLNDLNPSVE